VSDEQREILRESFGSVRWWKAYAVYLVIIAPLVTLDILFVRGPLEWVVNFLIVFGGLTVKDPIQRKVWP
jgi:hypothetical protein